LWSGTVFFGDGSEPADDWAVDRVYQENTAYCSVHCLEKARARQRNFELERALHKRYGKRR